jgi:hypothetical protein
VAEKALIDIATAAYDRLRLRHMTADEIVTAINAEAGRRVRAPPSGT